MCSDAAKQICSFRIHVRSANIRGWKWDIENQPRICTDLHGCEPRSISALFKVGLLLVDAKDARWVGPVCVVVRIEEAGVGEIVPTLT